MNATHRWLWKVAPAQTGLDVHRPATQERAWDTGWEWPRFVVRQLVDDGDASFTMVTGVYPWMVVVILTRELLVTGVRGVMESMGVSFGSKWSGKAKMILQSIVIPTTLFVVIVFKPHENRWALWICSVLMYATLIVTVWSGLPYVRGLRAVYAATRHTQPDADE